MIHFNEYHLRWLGPVGLFIFGSMFFRLPFWLEAEPTALLQATLVGLVAGGLFWQLGRWITQSMQHRLPGLERTPDRLLRLLLLLPVLVNLAVFFRFGLHWLLGSRTALWLGLVDYVTSLGIQLFYHVVYVGIYEGRYMLGQWQRTYLEKEEWARAQWQIRFYSLKSQVNPHFLFNSLNALSALIEESPQLASQFLDELSKIYRYLLQANEQELTPLYAEIAFIESYLHLLQTRHGTGLSVQLTVDKDYLKSSIPPLTLQLLVENAVKHNVVQASRPLLIDISTIETGQLRVRNNLQPRTKHIASPGVGLTNIAAQYRMLTQTDIIVCKEEGYFTVLLPLLQ